MSRSSQTYEKRFTRTFERQLPKLRDKTRIERIQKRVDQIIANPYANIDYGKGEWRGKRKDRVGGDRIIFTICEQCRKEHHQEYNNCIDCNTTPDNNLQSNEKVICSHIFDLRRTKYVHLLSQRSDQGEGP
jgi:mRNA-degrading endonuclease RelE of RelBE toxin-antitoxin system